jgi:hypothetical protein
MWRPTARDLLACIKTLRVDQARSASINGRIRTFGQNNFDGPNPPTTFILQSIDSIAGQSARTTDCMKTSVSGHWLPRVGAHKNGSFGAVFVIHGLRQEAFDESRLLLANEGSVRRSQTASA